MFSWHPESWWNIHIGQIKSFWAWTEANRAQGRRIPAAQQREGWGHSRWSSGRNNNACILARRTSLGLGAWLFLPWPRSNHCKHYGSSTAFFQGRRISLQKWSLNSKAHLQIQSITWWPNKAPVLPTTVLGSSLTHGLNSAYHFALIYIWVVLGFFQILSLLVTSFKGNREKQSFIEISIPCPVPKPAILTCALQGLDSSEHDCDIMCSVCSSSCWLQALWRLVGAQPDKTMKSERIQQESAHRCTDLTEIFFRVCVKQQISYFCCCGKQKFNSNSEHAVFVHLGEIQGIFLMAINSFAIPQCLQRRCETKKA